MIGRLVGSPVQLTVIGRPTDQTPSGLITAFGAIALGATGADDAGAPLIASLWALTSKV